MSNYNVTCLVIIVFPKNIWHITETNLMYIYHHCYLLCLALTISALCVILFSFDSRTNFPVSSKNKVSGNCVSKKQVSCKQLQANSTSLKIRNTNQYYQKERKKEHSLSSNYFHVNLITLNFK